VRIFRLETRTRKQRYFKNTVQDAIQYLRPGAIPPVSDSAREVHLGIKKVRLGIKTGAIFRARTVFSGFLLEIWPEIPLYSRLSHEHHQSSYCTFKSKLAVASGPLVKQYMRNGAGPTGNPLST
jgi:hypothetical protein